MPVYSVYVDMLYMHTIDKANIHVYVLNYCICGDSYEKLDCPGVAGRGVEVREQWFVII